MFDDKLPPFAFHPQRRPDDTAAERTLLTRLQLVTSERDSARQRVATLEQAMDILQEQLHAALVRVAALEMVG